MISQVKPIAKQFHETYDVLRKALAQVPAERLAWCPGGDADTIAGIVAHIVDANDRYISVIEQTAHESKPFEVAGVDHRLLSTALVESERRVLATLDRLSVERLREARATRWGDWDDGSGGNTLDVLWFTLQMVRHSAYHLGQVNAYLRILDA